MNKNDTSTHFSEAYYAVPSSSPHSEDVGNVEPRASPTEQNRSIVPSANKALVDITLSPPRGEDEKSTVVVRSENEIVPTDIKATSSSSSLSTSGTPPCHVLGRRSSRHSGYTLALLAAIMGNVLEFYDFSVYAFFAPEIGQLFFSSGSDTVRAIQTFTVFAGGFLMRPVGSVVLGAVGDKYGTAAALKWSIGLMTVPTIVTGLLPTYSKIGLAAPLLLTLCRLLQGLSVGGELIGALLHTADHSPAEHRGFFCGLVAVFGSMGNLVGSLVSVLMRHALSKQELLSWGWRIPFLAGSVLGLVGIFLRTKTGALKHGGEAGRRPTREEQVLIEMVECPIAVEEETVAAYREAARMEEEEEEEEEGEQRGKEGETGAVAARPSHPRSFCGILREAAAGDKPRFIRVVVLAALNNSLFYFNFVWLGTYMAELAPNPLGAAQAFSVTCVAQAVFIFGNPFWGAMGDWGGGLAKRLRWNIVGVVLSCFLPPCLFLLLRSGRASLSFLFAALTGLLMGFTVSGNYYAWVCESLNESPSRVLTTSVAYNVGAVVGGCTPMLASALSASPIFLAPILPLSAVAAAVAVVLGRYEWGEYVKRKAEGGKGGREEFLALRVEEGKEGKGKMAKAKVKARGEEPADTS
ncbi:major facilitator superfamily protein [Nannochloropsis gaditana]|uniref:Major facilitator superfamily protein n=1 Tax=Nannochloropsis gaditana TaxID=72520 RepID=W7TY94_9STRA|nr:major facilitator superfamily protein [Nannochloropsis gaditana]